MRIVSPRRVVYGREYSFNLGVKLFFIGNEVASIQIECLQSVLSPFLFLCMRCFSLLPLCCEALLSVGVRYLRSPSRLHCLNDCGVCQSLIFSRGLIDKVIAFGLTVGTSLSDGLVCLLFPSIELEKAFSKVSPTDC